MAENESAWGWGSTVATTTTTTLGGAALAVAGATTVTVAAPVILAGAAAGLVVGAVVSLGAKLIDWVYDKKVEIATSQAEKARATH